MIVLHHCPETRSARVLWLLHELGVPFEMVVHPFDKALRAPDFLALSPAGRVPAIEIDGQVLFESGAILEYLCERFPGPGLGRAPGHPERAEWLVWVHFAETISQHSAALTQGHIVLREDWMRSPTVLRLEARRLEKCFAALEGRLAGGRSCWRAGSRPPMSRSGRRWRWRAISRGSSRSRRWPRGGTGSRRARGSCARSPARARRGFMPGTSTPRPRPAAKSEYLNQGEGEGAWRSGSRYSR